MAGSFMNNRNVGAALPCRAVLHGHGEITWPQRAVTAAANTDPGHALVRLSEPRKRPPTGHTSPFYRCGVFSVSNRRECLVFAGSKVLPAMRHFCARVENVLDGDSISDQLSHKRNRNDVEFWPKEERWVLNRGRLANHE